MRFILAFFTAILGCCCCFFPSNPTKKNLNICMWMSMDDSSQVFWKWCISHIRELETEVINVLKCIANGTNYIVWKRLFTFSFVLDKKLKMKQVNIYKSHQMSCHA